MAALVLRLFLALTHENLLGIDGGAYIMGAQQVMGMDPPNQDFTRPPLGPGWLLVPFLHFWGYDTGYKVWSALFSVTYIPVIWLLARQWTPAQGRSVAIFTTIAAAFSLFAAELFVTGSLPLIGFALIGLGMWLMPDIHRSRWRFVLLALLVPLVVSVNMTSAGIAAITWPVYALVLLAQKRGKFLRNMLHICEAGLIGALWSLPLLYFYYGDVMFGSGNLVHPGPKFVLAPVSNWGWFLLVFGVAIAGLTWKYIEDYRVKAAAVVLLVFSLLAPVWSYDEAIINITFRGRYWAGLLAYPIIAVLILRLISSLANLLGQLKISPPRRLLTHIRQAAPLFLVAVAVFSFTRSFNAQAYYSTQVTPETLTALHIANIADPESGIIVNTFSMAWWTQAITGVHAPTVWTVPPPPKWQEEYEHVKCVIGWTCSSRAGIHSALRLNSRWVLFDTSFPDRNGTFLVEAPEGDPWEPAERAEWLELVYSEGNTRLYRVTSPAVGHLAQHTF